MTRQPTVSPDRVAQDQLRAFFERLERMHEERKAIGDDIKEIYAEARGNGFDTKVMKIVLHKRGMDHAERMEQEALVDLYMSALGMASGAARDDDDRAPAPAREIIEEFQPPRIASAADMRDAYRAGRPISQDFAFQNGSVYFIAFRGLDRIKIGVSRDATLRIADLEQIVGDIAEVLAVIPGNRQAEMAAHEHHAEWRIKGEWYRLCDEAVASIAAYATRAGARQIEHRTAIAADPDEGAPIAQPERPSSEPIQFTPKPFRPHCLNPGNSCAGQGREHCHRCTRAHEQAGVQLQVIGEIGR